MNQAKGTPDLEAHTATERFAELAEIVCARLAKNQRVRRNLPGAGRVRIDRQLPFLCVYRSPPANDDFGTRELVTTEAAYLFASADAEFREGIDRFCSRVSAALLEPFGRFLLIEIWSLTDAELSPEERRSRAPLFEIVSSHPERLASTIAALEEALSAVRIQGRAAHVRTRLADPVQPTGLPPLLSGEQSEGAARFHLGLGVKPLYRDAAAAARYPIVLQQMRWELAAALRRALAAFAASSGEEPGREQSLGPSSLTRASRLCDQELSEVALSFDFLLQATPVNADEAWKEFSRSGYAETPTFYYRPLPYDPRLLKRTLMSIELERMEDATVARLFREKQDELDTQLTALQHLDTPAFLYDSLSLYGGADADLAALARGLLAADQTPPPRSKTKQIGPAEFVQRARNEIDYYGQRLRAFNPRVEVVDHIAAGTMVSHERLLVSQSLRLRPERVEPLLHHEIGTHLLTYFNGGAQPLRQLATGLAGYERLQEGLAVLAEFLCGGLSVGRMRTIAARVVAVEAVAEGNPFPRTYARLRDECRLAPRESFITALRAHRGGGLTKDVIYLRGFRDVLRYLSAGHDIEPLYVGKIALHHLPFIQELRRRGIIEPPSVLPRFWENEGLRRRIEEFRGRSVLELLEVAS